MKAAWTMGGECPRRCLHIIILACMIQVFELICSGENKVGVCREELVPRSALSFAREVAARLRLRSHGLPAPAQVVDRKESVHGGRAADAPRVAAARGTPQARGIVWGPPEGRAVKVCTVRPREPSPAPVGEISAAGEGVRAVEGAQPALAGPEGLPAGSRGQGLALCKETTDLLLAGELGENGGVPQHTPRGRRAVRDAEVCRARRGRGAQAGERPHPLPGAAARGHSGRGHVPAAPPGSTHMCRDFCAFTTSSLEL